jgi:hypothetical protein
MDEKQSEKQVAGKIAKSKNSKMKALVRAGFFALFCVILLTGNYLWEESIDPYVSTYIDEVQYDGSRVNIPGNAYVVSEDGLAEDVLGYEGAGLQKSGFEEYIFTLNKGRIWGNFASLGSKVNIVIEGKVYLIPAYSNFDVSYDGDVVKIKNYHGNLYVGVLGEPIESGGYMGEYNDVFDNVLLIPEGVMIEIPMSRVSSKLGYLLFSKLAKEFSYDFIPEVMYEDDFVEDNIADGIKFRESLKEFYREDFENTYDDMKDFSSSFFDWLNENLVIFEAKKESEYLDRLNGYVYEALLANVASEALVAFDDFENSEEGFSDIFFSNWFKRLTAFDSSDPEFVVFDFLIDQANSNYDDLYLLALRLGAYHSSDAEDAFVSTYDSVENLFGFTSNDELNERFLAFYNQIFDTFLLNFSDLYQMKYFDMKDAVERELFALYSGGQLKEELKQSFVDRKIELLERLIQYFFEEDIEIEDARGLMSYLIESIDEYMPSKKSRAAVIKLFEQELEDVGDFWGYLNSVEYSKSSLYGASHRERYAVYLLEKEQVTGILDVQEDILGGAVVDKVTSDDVVDEVEVVFEEIDALDVIIEDITDTKKRFIKVAAILNGYAFDAEYDRDYGYVKNIYAYGELLSESNVKLDSLGDFLTKKLASVVEEAGIDESDDEETNAQKIAKTIIAKQVVEAGFGASMQDVDILDPVNAIYRLDDVVLSGNSDITVSFNFHANDATVTNVFVMKNGEGTTIMDIFPLEDLKNIVMDEDL